METVRKYGREDIEKIEGGFDGWYSAWMKMLAVRFSRSEIEQRLGIASTAGAKAARRHLAAIDATSSMTGQSQRRAQTGNVARAAGEEAMALRGALEIHELFPECAKASA
jgi:hypothetical protein